MSLKVAVITSVPSVTGRIQIDDYELNEVLGDEEAIAVRIDEIVRTIADSARRSITAEAELTVEIGGSVSLKGQGEAKWLFFNVGASTDRSDTLKVTLKTKISPAELT